MTNRLLAIAAVFAAIVAVTGFDLRSAGTASAPEPAQLTQSL